MSEFHESSKNNRWPIGIGVFSGAFVVLSLVLVMIASRQDFDLAELDYYNKGQDYQRHLDKAARAQASDSAVIVSYVKRDQRLLFSFSDVANSDAITGTITLYRPSNLRWDRVHDIELDVNMSQSIDASTLVPGLWRIKVDWEMDKGLYYYEQPFMKP